MSAGDENIKGLQWTTYSFYVEIVASTQVLEGFRHARSHVARLVYLIGVRATSKFDMRARAARVASLDRNVENVLVAL